MINVRKKKRPRALGIEVFNDERKRLKSIKKSFIQTD